MHHLPYKTIKFILWCVLAISTTLFLSTNFNVLFLATTIATLFAISCWLFLNSTRIKSDFSKVLSEEKYREYQEKTFMEKLKWGNKQGPKAKDSAPIFAFFSLISFYTAYLTSNGDISGKFTKFGYELFGMEGAIAVWCISGVLSLAISVETFIGNKLNET